MKHVDLLSKMELFVEASIKELWKSDKSEISGNGVFANTNIKKNKLIGLAFEKVRDTGKPDKDYKRTELGALVNHSKNSNIKLFEKSNKFYYVSSVEIQKDQELTIDYDSFPWEGEKEFN